tara:strand:+ start:635 stop:925 length:291 start_codon:yes stop_codon:yes gene_type:complete
MTIFEDMNELKNCVLEMEEYIPEEYLEILSFIDNAKLYNITNDSKQYLCINRLKKSLVLNGVVKPYEIKEWLETKRDEYRELVDYSLRENNYLQES